MRRFSLIFAITFCVPGLAFAQAGQIQVDATPVVAAYNGVVAALAKTKADEQKNLIDGIVRVLTITPAEGASEPDKEALASAKTLAVQKLLAAYPAGAAIRVRQTKVVDIFQSSANTITIGLAGPGIPATFGFTFGRETRARAADEIEIEGSYAFNESFVPGLLDVIRGDNALAILTKLVDILSTPSPR